MTPTKTTIEQAVKLYKDGFHREDQTIVFFNAYLEAVSALQKLMKNAHIRRRVDDEQLRPVDTIVGKSTIEDIQAILKKAPEDLEEE